MKEQENILDPLYWKRRIEVANRKGEIHQSVFLTSKEKFDAIEEKHRSILAKHVKEDDLVLDAGCGYGRLIDLMPKWWLHSYVGVDLSQAFIDICLEKYPGFLFVTAELESYLKILHPKVFDLAVLSSMRPMLIRYLGGDAWGRIETELKRVAKKILYLEYNVEHEGEIECQ